MEIGNNIGSAAKKLGKKKISGGGGCSVTDKDLKGVVGGGGTIPPSGNTNAIGQAPKPAKPIDDAVVSKEALQGGGGSGDLNSIKDLLAGLCG